MSYTEKPMRIVSFKLPAELDRELTDLARKRRSSRSAVVRDALDAYTRRPRTSVISAAGDLIGSIKVGPTDRSDGARHMANYGK